MDARGHRPVRSPPLHATALKYAVASALYSTQCYVMYRLCESLFCHKKTIHYYYTNTMVKSC